MPEAHLIIPHPNQDAVLVLDGALPVVAASDLLVAGDRLGLPLAVVRTHHRDAEDRVVLCELLDGVPPNASWCSAEKIRTIPRHAEAVARFFAEGEPQAAAPWMRRGWFAATMEWADGVLSRSGRRRSGKPRQLRHWSLSAVVRVPAEGGDVVVKETLPMFAAEPAVMRVLDAIDPGVVPRVLEIDAIRNRWAMDAADARDADVEPGGLTALAQFQRRARAHVDELRSAGCAERDLIALAPAIEALCEREDILFASGWNLQSTDGRLPPRPFTTDDRHALIAALPEIARRTHRLASLGIPRTVIHGDFHVHNVMWTKDRWMIFDWAHASIGHPFMDLPMWIQWARDPSSSVRAYLEVWGPGLDHAWSDAHPIALFHHALTLVPLAEPGRLEPAAEWAAGVQRRLIQGLELLRA